jgi:4-aminobutyrate--pyruvate transaminase
MGLIGAPELVADKCSKRSFAPADGIGARVMRFAEEEGPIVRAIGGDNIALCPPLTISEAESKTCSPGSPARLTVLLDKASAESLIA